VILLIKSGFQYFVLLPILLHFKGKPLAMFTNMLADWFATELTFLKLPLGW